MNSAVETLSELESARSSGGTSLVTYIISAKSNLADCIQHLQKEFSTASNIKNRENRTGVQASLSSMITQLKMLKAVPNNGIAGFGGRWRPVGDCLV